MNMIKSIWCRVEMQIKAQYCTWYCDTNIFLWCICMCLLSNTKGDGMIYFEEQNPLEGRETKVVRTSSRLKWLVPRKIESGNISPLGVPERSPKPAFLALSVVLCSVVMVTGSCCSDNGYWICNLSEELKGSLSFSYHAGFLLGWNLKLW